MTAGPLTYPFVVKKPDRWFGEQYPIANGVTLNYGDLCQWNSSGQIVPASFTAAAIVKPMGVFWQQTNNATDNYATGDANLDVMGNIARYAIITGTSVNPLDSTRIPGLTAGAPVYLGALPITTVSNYTCTFPATNGDAVIQVGWVNGDATALLIDCSGIQAYMQLQASGNSTVTAA